MAFCVFFKKVTIRLLTHLCAQNLLWIITKWPQLINLEFETQNPPPLFFLLFYSERLIEISNPNMYRCLRAAQRGLCVLIVPVIVVSVVYATVYPSISFGVIFCFSRVYKKEGRKGSSRRSRLIILAVVLRVPDRHKLKTHISRFLKMKALRIPMYFSNLNVWICLSNPLITENSNRNPHWN